MAGGASFVPAMILRAVAPTADRKKPTDWHAEPGVFWVYVIRSQSSGTLYVGHTNDLEGRASGSTTTLRVTAASTPNATLDRGLSCTLSAVQPARRPWRANAS